MTPLRASISKTGPRLVEVARAEDGRAFEVPGDALLSVFGEYDPVRKQTAPNTPALVGDQTAAAVVVYGVAGGGALVPVACAFISSSSPMPVHMVTVGGLAFEKYKVFAASPTKELRLSVVAIPHAAGPRVWVDERCQAKPVVLGPVLGLPAAGVFMPTQEPATEATAAAMLADLDNVSANFPQIGPQAAASALPVTIATDDQVRTDVHTVATRTPALGAAASAAASPVTIATDDATIGKLTQPTRSYPITLNDATDLSATVTKGVIVGTGGTLVFRLSGDAGDTTLTVYSGQFIPGNFKLCKATGTTASGLVGLGG